MCEVEFDWPATTRFEVDEQRAVARVQDVARVRLAVQQLLWGSSVKDHLRHFPERVCEKVPVRLTEPRSPLETPDEVRSIGDPIREMRCGEIDALQAVVKPREGSRVVGWWELAIWPGRVKGP